MAKNTYREGLLCSVAGVDYWHTGATYWLSYDEAGNNQFDLREMPSFKELLAKHDWDCSIFFSERWRISSQTHPEVRKSLDLLYDHREVLWWELVVDYLRTYHECQADVAELQAVLAAKTLPQDVVGAINPFGVIPNRMLARLNARDTERPFEPPEDCI